jgi:hypothetical protein
LTVAFAINDFDRGTKADDANREAYHDGISENVTRCQGRALDC